MNLKKCIFAIVMFGLFCISGLCLPKNCCKTQFQKNVEDIVMSYLRGQLNRKLIATIYGDRLKEINPEENQGIAIFEYDVGCYQVKMRYLDMKSKNDDVNLESFCIYAKDGDNEALPLSVFFDLCGKEEHYEPRSKIPLASFKYVEGDSPFRIRILVQDAFIIYKDLRNSFGGMIELKRYPKSWDVEK